MRLRLLLVVCMTTATIAIGRQQPLAAADPPKAARLKVDFNAKGISVLNYGTTNLLADGTFLWSSERTGARHLYLYEAAGQLIRAVTQGPWPVDQLEGRGPPGS